MYPFYSTVKKSALTEEKEESIKKSVALGTRKDFKIIFFILL